MRRWPSFFRAVDGRTRRVPTILDPYELQRFVDAQEGVYERARAELRAGRKESHWMWYIFPQIKGLGLSPMAQRYAISSIDEARAYLAHPLLGPRLRECCRLVASADSNSIEDIFGFPDNLKFHSSATLFAQAGADNQVFLDALQKYFRAEFDGKTLRQL
jgi:uncharacterized protein (DUF1810 family)